MKTENISTDVLVIGGGAAGCLAALKSQSLGAKTIIVSKGTVGKSGASPMAGAIVAPPEKLPPIRLLRLLRGIYKFVPIPIPAKHKKPIETFISKQAYYLSDQDYVLDAILWILTKWFPHIEDKGLYFRRTDDGRLATPPGGGMTFVYKFGFNGVAYMEQLRKELMLSDVKVLEGCSATSLLMNAGRCVGAILLDFVKGRLYSIKAKATVLATGHGNWLATRATATREQVGNGLALAARAGATLYNLEMQWWHASDILGPESWMRLHNYPNALPLTHHQLRMLNSEGEVFLDCSDYKLPTPYTIQVKKLYEQVRKGKARFDGGYYASYSHIEPQALKDFLYHWDFYEKLKLDPTKDPIECGVNWHFTLGGVRVDPSSFQTGVEGLFAAGGAAGHHGLPFVSYDGTMVGIQASNYAKHTIEPEVDESQVKSEEDKVNDLRSTFSRRDGIPPSHIKKKIRQIMWENAGFVKTGEKLRRGLELLESIRRDTVPKMCVGTDTERFNWDLVDAIDVYDMLDVCRYSIRAYLAREESRGPFFREDHPYTDYKNWTKYILISVKDGGVNVDFEPVKLAYVQPPTEKADYLANPYA